MPPAWLPFASHLVIVAFSAWRVWQVERATGVRAFGFDKDADLQAVAARNWRAATAGALGFALIAWLAPEWEIVLGKPDWAEAPGLKWTAAVLCVLSTAMAIIAQTQMGAFWRVGVPQEGPGALIREGLFAWSRNPVFVAMIGAVVGLFFWSPHLGTAALVALIWATAIIQVRIEEKALREAHPHDYEDYAAHVGRWFGRRSVGRS